MMVYICTEFHENILNGIRVMERTQKVNGWTDGWTDGGYDGRIKIIIKYSLLSRALRTFVFTNFFLYN